MSSNAFIILFITLLFCLSQGCVFRLLSPIYNTRPLCVGTGGLSQLSSHRHGTGIHQSPSMPSFPHCLPPDGLSLKFSVRALQPKLSPGSTSPGSLDAVAVKKTRGRSILKDGSWEMERAKAKLWQQKKPPKNIGIECVDVGPEEEDAAEAHQGAREACVTSAERQDSDEKRQC